MRCIHLPRLLLLSLAGVLIQCTSQPPIERAVRGVTAPQAVRGVTAPQPVATHIPSVDGAGRPSFTWAIGAAPAQADDAPAAARAHLEALGTARLDEVQVQPGPRGAPVGARARQADLSMAQTRA